MGAAPARAILSYNSFLGKTEAVFKQQPEAATERSEKNASWMRYISVSLPCIDRRDCGSGFQI